MNEFWEQVNQQIASVTGKPFGGTASPGPGGGCINTAWLLADGHQRYFVKTNRAELGSMFAAEARGLAAIAATGTIRVPRPICHGSSGAKSWLVLEWLNLNAHGDWALMGRQLAQLHQKPVGEQFGWEEDNYIGATRQVNQPNAGWPEFFAGQRLGFQAELARRTGARLPELHRLLDALPQLFRDHQPKPALLHGDLWSGNAGFSAHGEPVLFDVAVYRGDAETDLAMTQLFGGFPAAFYQGYREFSPEQKGCARRHTLYNLYHVLNHYNLFGGHYLQQANRMIEELLS